MSGTLRALGTATFDPGGVNKAKTTSEVHVVMSEGLHDTAIITLRDTPTSAPELQPGIPVKLVYGWNPMDLDWFYGYIDHVEAKYDRSHQQPLIYNDVVCLGASYVMKDPFVGTFNNTQASFVVSQLAKKYLLALLVDSSDFVWPHLASPGMSAWSFINQMAAQTGYTVSCNKTLLRFVSVETALRQRWVNMPVFHTRNTANSFAQQGITRFQALTGESFPKTKSLRSINGINLVTGQIVTAYNDGSNLLTSQLGASSTYPFFGEQISDQVADSQGHAQAIVDGMSQTHRWAYQATATLVGLTWVKQGVPIILKGIDATNDGVWWVQEVDHKITAEGYAMDVCLGRDSKGDSGARPAATTGTAYSLNDPLTYSAVNAPKTVLVNRRWRASNNFVSNVS